MKRTKKDNEMIFLWQLISIAHKNKLLTTIEKFLITVVGFPILLNYFSKKISATEALKLSYKAIK